MPSLEDAQRWIAGQVSELPPEVQSKFLQAVTIAYKAGHEAAQKEIQEASKILISGRIN